jgi:hypothetical protein
MATRSLVGWIKTIIIGLIVAAEVQSALIEICIILSAASAAKGLASIPTLAAFLSIVLWSLGPKWTRYINVMLASTAAFFAVGLASSCLGLPYGAPGIATATLIIWVASSKQAPSVQDHLPVGITNYPRQRVLQSEDEVKRIVSHLYAMKYSSTLTEVGRSLLSELRSQSESGNIAVVLHRSEENRPTATVGSQQPLRLQRTGTDRALTWESSLISFGLDIQSLSPYTLPAKLALPDGPEVDIPANLAHGKWAVVCSEPSQTAARSVASSLYRSGWRVDSTNLGYVEKIRQTLDRRGAPNASVAIGPLHESNHDLVIQICSMPSALEDKDLAGAVLAPFLANREQFLPENMAFVASSPRPLMLIGKGLVMEWGEEGWK